MPATPLFESNGAPSKPLKEILSITKCDAGRAEVIRDLTQAAWRVDLPSAKIVESHDELREVLLPHFRTLGLIGVPPLHTRNFQWTCILGATYTAMHKRLAVAVRAYEDGVHWTNTAYLVSHRPLFFQDKETEEILRKPVEGGLRFARQEAETGLYKPPTCEKDLPFHITRQTHGQRPWDCAREVVATADNRPNGTPAGTLETFQAFAEQCDPHGEALLIISSQPHMLRQLIDGVSVLKDRFNRYEVTGYPPPKEDAINVTATLDELAKLIYNVVGAT